MDCQSWVLGGGWQGAMSYPAGNEYTEDLGGGDGDIYLAFLASSHTPAPYSREYHKGPAFVFDFSLRWKWARDAWRDFSIYLNTFKESWTELERDLQ